MAHFTLKPRLANLTLVHAVAMLDMILAELESLRTEYAHGFDSWSRLLKVFVVVWREKEGARFAEPPLLSQVFYVALVGMHSIRLLVVEP